MSDMSTNTSRLAYNDQQQGDTLSILRYCSMLINLITCTSIIDGITQNEVTHHVPVPKREKKKLVECLFVTRASPDWHQETFQSTIDSDVSAETSR